MRIVITPSMKAIIGIVTSPTSRSNLTLLGNSIVLIPPGVCDTFLWIILSRQGSSLNDEIYPFRIGRGEKWRAKEVIRGVKERLEIKTYVNWSGNWSSKFFKIFGNFLKMQRMIWWLESLEVKNALKVLNCDEKRRKWYSWAFIYGTENEGDFILPKSWREIWTVGSKLHW